MATTTIAEPKVIDLTSSVYWLLGQLIFVLAVAGGIYWWRRRRPHRHKYMELPQELKERDSDSTGTRRRAPVSVFDYTTNTFK